MKRLEQEWWEDFDKLSDWLLDQENIEVVNVFQKDGGWRIVYWEITGEVTDTKVDVRCDGKKNL
jgi:hypothetical protein